MTRIRRITAALATLAGALAAVTAAAPAALADRVPPPGGAGPASGLARTVPWPKTPLPPAQPRYTPSSRAACPAGRSP